MVKYHHYSSGTAPVLSTTFFRFMLGMSSAPAPPVEVHEKRSPHLRRKTQDGTPQMVMGSKPCYFRYPNIDGDWMVMPLNIVIVGVDPSPNSDFI